MAGGMGWLTPRWDLGKEGNSGADAELCLGPSEAEGSGRNPGDAQSAAGF